MMSTTTEISLHDLLDKTLQLNRDLAPLGQQIAELLARFNEETGGHRADIRLTCDWREYIRTGEPVGKWALAQVDLTAKEMPLPRVAARQPL